jgi:peptidyl-prolyl cis-trans isomerase B (cyclophilin B)
VPSKRPRRPTVLAIGALTALAALTLGAAGCGSGGGEGASNNSSRGSTAATSERLRTAPHSPAAAAVPPCGRAGAAKPKHVSYQAPPQTVKKGEELTAIVRTSCGKFSIALDARRFPTTVNSFVFLAERGFYDGVPFDKAGAGKYLHGGDPPGRAIGPGYAVTGEIPTGYFYRHGAVALAQPEEAPEGSFHKAGSQFFIVLAKPWIDTSSIYPPIGTIEGGYGVHDRISQLGPHAEYPSNVGVVGPVAKLRRPVVIEGVSIKRGKR